MNQDSIHIGNAFADLSFDLLTDMVGSFQFPHPETYVGFDKLEASGISSSKGMNGSYLRVGQNSAFHLVHALKIKGSIEKNPNGIEKNGDPGLENKHHNHQGCHLIQGPVQ